MKNKKILWVGLLVILFVFGCLGYFRYNQINAHSDQYGVTQEKFFPKNKWVHAHHVSFIIHEAKVRKTKDEIQTRIKLSLHQTGDSNYGNKKGNTNFVENMFLNNPYGISNQPIEILDRNFHRIPPNEILKVKQPYFVFLNIPRYSYERRNKKLRFSFLVPVKNHFVKYSLLLE